jgi:hypothetical protein
MLFLAILSPASAGDFTGNLFSTEFRTESGWLDPGVVVGFNPQPDPPGFELVERTLAVSTVKFERGLDTGVFVGVGEEKHAVRSVELLGDERSEPIVVYGKGAAEKFLPPGPCFDLRVTFDEGSVMTLHVEITTDGGYIDPGSLVGFNPQPEPPGDKGETVGFNPQPDPPGSPAWVEIDLSAYARESAALVVTVSAEKDGYTLPLR